MADVMAEFVSQGGRLNKAKKIEKIISIYLNILEPKNIRILDIGCGTGEIISYFNKNNNDIYAVDVRNRINKKLKIKNFTIVDSELLPFDDNFFDVIISNHVIEHILEQDTHMQEIRRCLKENGICYYATPNKFFPIEPHYNIPLIHYFGNNFFNKIVKLMGKYEEDLFLLNYIEMKASFKKNAFHFTEFTSKILKDPETYYLGEKYFKFIPLYLLEFLQYITPTNIFILSKGCLVPNVHVS